MTETENTTFAQDAIVAPATARDFVKKAAEAAKDHATTLHANVEKATTTVEQTLANTVGEVAKLTRQAHQVAYEDAEAFFAGVDKLASAKSLSEAVQVYVDYMRGRGDAALARARAARAPTWSPWLNVSNRNGSGARADQSLSVFTWRPRHPTMGVS